MKMTEGFAVPRPEKRVKVPRRQPTGNQFKDKSITQEDEFSARLSIDIGLPYERVPGSGAFEGIPGDVRPNRRVKLKMHRWLIELKDMAVTTAKGEHILSIKLAWLQKIMQQAEQERSLPALAYRFTGDDETWVVVRYSDFANLLREHVEMDSILEGAGYENDTP
jgi:hypothetical protein